MKTFNQTIKEAMLNKTVPVDQAAAWADIANTLDQKRKRPWLVWFFFGLGVVSMATWYLTKVIPNESNSYEVALSYKETKAQEEQSSFMDSEQLNQNNKNLNSTPITDINKERKSRQEKNQKIVLKKKETKLVNTQHTTTFKATPVGNNSGSTNKLEKQSPGLTQKIYKSRQKENISSIPLNSNSLQKEPIKASPLPLPNKLITINLQKLIRPFDFPNKTLTYSTKEPKLTKKSFWNFFPEIAFTHGVGIVPMASNYTDLSQGEFMEVVNKRSTMTGIELLFKIHKGFHFKTGYLEHSRRFGLNQINGGDGVNAQYNSSIPLMLHYNFGKRNTKPYIALGMHLNSWFLSGRGYTGANTGLGYTRETMKGKRFTPVIEIGTSFKVFNQKFSLAAEANFSDTRVFESRFVEVDGSRIIKQFGEGYSNGTYFALKAKYHFNVLDIINLKEKIKNIKKPGEEDNNRFKNEIGIEGFGAGVIGSLYYQRFWKLSDRLRIAIKPGVLFIPEYEEKGTFVGNFGDDLKPMGLYVPTSVIAYIGQPQLSLQLGIANTFHYGPLRTVIPNGQTHRTETGQFLITGLRSEFGRFSVHGQFNLVFTKEEVFTKQKEWFVGTKLGVGVGYQF